METKHYEVVIKLIGNQNPCHSGHKIGDEWVFNYMTPAGMCGLAFNAIYPVALAIQFGAIFLLQEDPDVITIACPDLNDIVYTGMYYLELTRGCVLSLSGKNIRQLKHISWSS